MFSDGFDCLADKNALKSYILSLYKQWEYSGAVEKASIVRFTRATSKRWLGESIGDGESV